MLLGVFAVGLACNRVHYLRQDRKTQEKALSMKAIIKAFQPHGDFSGEELSDMCTS